MEKPHSWSWLLAYLTTRRDLGGQVPEALYIVAFSCEVYKMADSQLHLTWKICRAFPFRPENKEVEIQGHFQDDLQILDEIAFGGELREHQVKRSLHTDREEKIRREPWREEPAEMEIQGLNKWEEILGI